MKLVGSQLTETTLRFSAPVKTAVGTLRCRPSLMLSLETETGHRAAGEASPLPGFSVETLADVRTALEEWLPYLLRLSHHNFSTPDEIYRVVEHLGGPPSAQHAVEQALLGLLALHRGVPAITLLSQAPTQFVPVHRLVETPDQAIDAVQARVGTIKVKVGAHSIKEDTDRLLAIRNAVGNSIDIRVDANGAYTFPEALQAIEGFRSANVDALEEPIRGRDLVQLAQLRQHSPIFLLADESVRNGQDLERCIGLEAADGVVLKPMLLGGPIHSYRLAQRAIEAGLMCSVTTTFDGVLGRRSALWVAASLPADARLSCGLMTGRFLEDGQPEAGPVHSGAMWLPDSTIKGMGL